MRDSDGGFSQSLFRACLSLTVLLAMASCSVAALATNGAWATAGAAFLLIGTPFCLLMTGFVWAVNRWF